MKKIEHPINTKRFDAYKLNATPCTDCGYCKGETKCAFRDLDKLYAAIEKCDLLVIATPVYNMSFPSPMKAILDRFQRYYNARFFQGLRPAIGKHRKAVLLAVAGSEGEEGDVMIKQLRQSFSVMNTELLAYAVINGLDKKKADENDEKIIACAEKANRFLSDSSL